MYEVCIRSICMSPCILMYTKKEAPLNARSHLRAAEVMWQSWLKSESQMIALVEKLWLYASRTLLEISSFATANESLTSGAVEVTRSLLFLIRLLVAGNSHCEQDQFKNATASRCCELIQSNCPLIAYLSWLASGKVLNTLSILP